MPINPYEPAQSPENPAPIKSVARSPWVSLGLAAVLAVIALEVLLSSKRSNQGLPRRYATYDSEIFFEVWSLTPEVFAYFLFGISAILTGVSLVGFGMPLSKKQK